MTDSAITALAFLSTIDIVVGVVCTLPGGLVADYFAERRPLVLMAGAVLTVFQPLVNAYLPDFTAVCVANIVGDVVGGLTSPANGALLCDCIPTDARTGLPVNPSRDYLFMGYAGRIPEILIPAALALAFGAFESRAEAYRTFFLLAAAIHLCSSLLFLKVDRELRRANAARRSHGDGDGGVAAALPAAAAAAAAAAASSMPSGAWVCDAMLFRTARPRQGASGGVAAGASRSQGFGSAARSRALN